jgi:hypothetical protein
LIGVCVCVNEYSANWHINTGRLDTHELGSAVKNGIDAVTFGLGTSDMVIGATMATSNCINNHGTTGCVLAAERSISSAVRRTSDRVGVCTRQHGVAGCVEQGAVHAGQWALHTTAAIGGALTRATGAIAKGTYNGVVGTISVSTWCTLHPSACAKSIHKGLHNINHAISNPVSQCVQRAGGSLLGCLGGVRNNARRSHDDWRLRGLEQQLLDNANNPARIVKIQRKIDQLKIELQQEQQRAPQQQQQ